MLGMNTSSFDRFPRRALETGGFGLCMVDTLMKRSSFVRHEVDLGVRL